jgi:hypothetical protein
MQSMIEVIRLLWINYTDRAFLLLDSQVSSLAHFQHAAISNR